MRVIDLDFSDNNVVIIGGAGHVGKSVSSQLITRGANLIIVDKDEVSLEGLVDNLNQRERRLIDFYACDLESPQERNKVFSSIQKKYSELNGIVNCAAFVGDSNLPGWNVPFSQQSIETWRRAIEVNLTSIFEACQILTPSLLQASGSSVVNISSIYGEKGPRWELYEGTAMGSPAAYGVSKAGLIQLTRWLSTTLAPRVRVNSIVAGGIQRNQPQQFVDRYCRDVPLGRMAVESDLVGPVLFLLSGMSTYITGETLHVDGGRGVW